MKQQKLVAVIPPELSGQEFADIWQKWLEDRKARGFPVTTHAADIHLAKLAGYVRTGGVASAIASLKQSIERGYRGIWYVEAVRPEISIDDNEFPRWKREHRGFCVLWAIEHPGVSDDALADASEAIMKSETEDEAKRIREAFCK